MEHVHEHRLVAGGREHHVRQATQIGDVERAVVGGPVVTHQPGAIHGEHDVQLLEAHVVDDLVVRPLQEGRVDRSDRLAPMQSEARREQHRLLLGDPHVVVAVGKLALKDVQPGARVHGRGDPDHPFIATASRPDAPE